ncbi:unnamed protein product [Paramecium primaurelia]|uniref:Uncharacterized protein n=1 Tax=Paramecium primaurelia TaxID=5886 RepID=A0A8S1MJT1_PARPR|nr:unnamed protein product [Paramecium primaurelia]
MDEILYFYDEEEASNINLSQEYFLNSDKNNKIPSTLFSECTIPNERKILSKVLKKVIKTSLCQAMNEFQLIYLAFRQKKRQIYQKNSINLINILVNLFYRQSFETLIEYIQKNVIEFDEDDVIKYNQMLDDNKIIGMEIQPTGNEGQAAEPVELDKLGNSLQNIPVPIGYQQTKRNLKKKTTKIQETLEKSNSQNNKFSLTPLSQSYASISQNQSLTSLQKQNSQEQLAQIQKNKLAQQFKRMGSVQLSGTFKKS